MEGGGQRGIPQPPSPSGRPCRRGPRRHSAVIGMAGHAIGPKVTMVSGRTASMTLRTNAAPDKGDTVAPAVPETQPVMLVHAYGGEAGGQLAPPQSGHSGVGVGTEDGLAGVAVSGGEHHDSLAVSPDQGHQPGGQVGLVIRVGRRRAASRRSI